MEKFMEFLGFTRCQICGEWVFSSLGLFSKISIGSVCKHCGWEQVSGWELSHPNMELGQNGGLSFNSFKRKYEWRKAHSVQTKIKG